MRNDDGGGRFFRDDLPRIGKPQPKFQFGGGEQFEDFEVIFKNWDGGIAPRVAFALFRAESQLAADVLVMINCVPASMCSR